MRLDSRLRRVNAGRGRKYWSYETMCYVRRRRARRKALEAPCRPDYPGGLKQAPRGVLGSQEGEGKGDRPDRVPPQSGPGELEYSF